MALDRRSLDLEHLRPILSLVVVIWVVQIANWVLRYAPNQWFGLDPRTFEGLLGIPLSPLLHANFGHIVANTVPLLVLGGMAAMASPKRFFEATFVIIVLGGAMVWLLARGGNKTHVGASGLIFGYLGYVVALGVFERSLKAIVFAALAVLLYGGMIWGVFPTNRGVSWESHLFGGIAGVAAAWRMRHDGRETPHVT